MNVAVVSSQVQKLTVSEKEEPKEGSKITAVSKQIFQCGHCGRNFRKDWESVPGRHFFCFNDGELEALVGRTARPLLQQNRK